MRVPEWMFYPLTLLFLSHVGERKVGEKGGGANFKRVIAL
jgi:hypothetical protein